MMIHRVHAPEGGQRPTKDVQTGGLPACTLAPAKAEGEGGEGSEL